jgi:hypothetical protein
MNVALWTIQVILAVAFAWSGFTKLSGPMDALQEGSPALRDLEGGFVRFLGAAELAGALLLVIPMAIGFVPELTPLAAMALLAVLVAAAGSHLRLGELRRAAFPAVLGLLTGAVALGRWSLTQH